MDIGFTSDSVPVTLYYSFLLETKNRRIGAKPVSFYSGISKKTEGY